MTKEIILEVLKDTFVPAVHLQIDVEKLGAAIDSKFGGAFYWPEGEALPGYEGYGEMEFLAQINFAQMPSLAGFPRQGLIQFFLCTNEEGMEEMNSCEFSADGRFKVVYYPEINGEGSVHEAQVLTEERWYMDKLEGTMVFQVVDEAATLSIGEDGFLTDYGYEAAKGVLSLELLEKAGYDLANCPDTDQFCLDFGNWGCKVGGHPAVRQGDIRSEEGGQGYTVLLFQYDLTLPRELEADTFAFFIKPEDLACGKFDDILLYWHNCY